MLANKNVLPGTVVNYIHSICEDLKLEDIKFLIMHCPTSVRLQSRLHENFIQNFKKLFRKPTFITNFNIKAAN